MFDSGKRLRVLTLIDGIGVVGGGERFARQLTVALDSQRFERTLCVSRWSPQDASEPAAAAAAAEVREAGVELLTLERRSRVDLAAWRPLLRRLRRGEVDVLHAHKFGSNVWGALLGGLTRVPVVVAQEQTWSYEGKPLRRLLDRELIDRVADQFIAVSSADRERMIALERIPADHVIVVPNAINASEPRGHDVRAELGIAPLAPVIGVVCVLRPQKALPNLIQAGALLRSKHPDLRILIAGDGPERASLENETKRHGLGDQVLFAGARDDVADVLAAVDVAALSSDFEGTPLAVMEYMAAAKPIVATRVGGVPELIDEGVHGLLVQPGDPAALAAGLERMLDDREAAAAMGQRARERQQLEFDISGTAKRVEDLYLRLYAASGRRSESAS